MGKGRKAKNRNSRWYKQAMIKTLTPMVRTTALAVNRKAKIWNAILSMDEGRFDLQIPAINTHVFSADKSKRVVQISNPGAGCRAAGLGLKSKQFVYDIYKSVTDLWSTAPFGYQVFYAILENGEVITVTEGELTSSASDLIDAATGDGSKDIVYDIQRVASMEYSNGTPYFRSRVSIDLKKYAKKYLADIKEKEIDESSPNYLEFVVGVILFGQPAQTINVHNNWQEASHLEDFRVKKIL